MELIIKLAGIALCGAVFAAFLRPLSPAFAVLTALTCGVLILMQTVSPVGQLLETTARFMDAAGIRSELYVPVIKAVGIAVVVHVTAQLCRDAGEGALGMKLEIAGTAAALAVCAPLMEQVFALLEDMLL